MENKAYLDENDFIISEAVGDQTTESVLEQDKMYHFLIDKLRGENKPVKILINISQMKKINTKARLAAIQTVPNLKFDKLALYGGDSLNKNIVIFVLAALRKKDIRYFDTKEEAIQWLKEPN